MTHARRNVYHVKAYNEQGYCFYYQIIANSELEAQARALMKIHDELNFSVDEFERIDVQQSARLTMI